MAALFLMRYLFFMSLFLSTACSEVFFYPQQEHLMTPQDIGLDYENVYLQAADGTKLHAWFLPATKLPRGTVLFLHGNAENISTHIGSVHWLPAAGYNVFLLDYRGYGQSGGRARLPNLFLDVDAALEHLVAHAEKYSPPLILLGQSIGGALAISTLAHSPHKNKVQTLVIESAFSSYRQIAREKLRAFWPTYLFSYPLSFFISNYRSPVREIHKLGGIPLLIIHGDADQTVPVHHSQQLFEAALEPKELWIVPEGNHIDAFNQEHYRKRFIDYLDGIKKEK